MKQISEPHPPRAEFIHVEEEWHPCERAVSLRVVNTWFSCGDGGNEVYVTETQETWVAGEQFCQRQGSHLASFPQITACKSSLLSLLGLAVEVHTSYTRLLDGLHYRDVGNVLQLSDSVIDVKRIPDNCTDTFLGNSLPPEDRRCSITNTVVCGRNPAYMEPSTVCGSYKMTYHSISFSADDANRTCRQRYGGWLLSTNMQQLSCVSQLLNSSQGLRDNNATTIPLYTSGTTGSAECEVYSPSRSAVLQDSCTAARPTVCVSRYCNGSDNLVAVRNEDRCQCRPGFIRTSAHSCSNILSTVGQDDSNITLFRWFESKWRVERVFTKQMVTQLANLSLPPGMFAFRSAALIVYTFSTSLQPADTVVAELARNASLFLRVNASSGGTVLSTVGRSLSNFTVWFRRFNFKCYNATNITVSCSFSPFNQTLRFEDGLYEVAVSPHSSSVLSVPALYRIHPRPTSAPTLMTSLPYSSTSVMVPPSGGESTPSLFSSSPSSSNAPSPKGSMGGLFAGIGSAVALLVGLLILACVVLVRRRRKGGVNIQAQRTEPVGITGGDQSESAVYAAGTSMRNLSVRYSISSSPPTPASPTAVQESTAPVSHAQSSAPNSPSQIPFYEEVVTQALGASTLPSTATSTATNDSDKQPTLPARNSLILSSSSVVSKPGRITPRKPSRRRAKKTADAAVKLSPYTDYMDPFDVRLDNKAGEDVARTTGYASSTAQNSNAAIAATAKTTKHDTTPAAGTSVSMATASATTPVFQSEEEARAASLQTAVPGPVYNEVSLPKKSEEEAQAESLPAAIPGFVYAEVVACGKVVEPQRVLTNPNAENDGLASDQDSHDSPIRGTASPRNDDTPVEAYSKENKNFDQGSTEE
ncbi:uncharacterized protein LOC135825639 isoform X2 [Sycon ciliatum]|uniref:uncharacterized protein LOC135825639 isoform X2 n=1 Tax=Sycon ciliatum TaxID=27933 RepID=UPI0031F64F33